MYMRLAENDDFSMLPAEKLMKLYRTGTLSGKPAEEGLEKELIAQMDDVELEFVQGIISDERMDNENNDHILREETFFPQGMDIELSRHLRYSTLYDHSHDFLEMIYVYKGACANVLGNASLEMSEGDFCIMPTNTRHHLEVFNDSCLVFNILVRRSTFSSAFFELLSGNDLLSDLFHRMVYNIDSHRVLVFNTKGNENISGIVMDMYKVSFEKRKYLNRILDSYLKLLMAMLLSDYENNCNFMETRASSGQLQSSIIPVLEFINLNYASTTLNELAQHFCYTEAHMSRMIKTATGQTFTEIIQQLRLKKASELLKNQSMSVEDIIGSVGYSDHSNFYRIFKKKFGMTPAEYRETSAGQ